MNFGSWKIGSFLSRDKAFIEVTTKEKPKLISAYFIQLFSLCQLYNVHMDSQVYGTELL